jgi:oxalate decarboxylase/phosphoglucose isomerase-like protein (cupin superfamily)
MEWFMALSGKAKLITLPSEKMDKKNSDDLTIEVLESDCLKPLYVLLIPPKLAHWIVNYSKELFIMASFSSKEFKKEENIDYKRDQEFWRQETDRLLAKQLEGRLKLLKTGVADEK